MRPIRVPCPYQMMYDAVFFASPLLMLLPQPPVNAEGSAAEVEPAVAVVAFRIVNPL
jgi:hypothetical protein